MVEPRQVERLLNRSFEVVQTGQVTVVSPNLMGSSSFEVVTYGLDYEPIIFAFVSFAPTGTRYLMPYQDVDVTGGADNGKVRGQVAYEVVSGDITFYFRNITAALNQTAYIRYYICRDPAA